MKKLLFLFFFLPSVLFAQDQQRQLLLYNIGLGGVTAGIGAVINKPKDTRWEKALLRGFWQGCTGGLLNYAGKKTVYLINKNKEYLYAWPAKLLHAAGSSIIENAALNEPFLQNWNIDLGPVRLDFSVNGKKKFKTRFLPVSIYSVIAGANKGSFSLLQTLRTGELVFVNHNSKFIWSRGAWRGGVSLARSIAVGEEWDDSHLIMAHEIVHQYQYRDYQVFNTWLKPLERKVKSKTINRIFSRYVYADVPYFLVPYAAEGRHDYDHYFNNFFEFEAHRFATNSRIPR